MNVRVYVCARRRGPRPPSHAAAAPPVCCVRVPALLVFALHGTGKETVCTNRCASWCTPVVRVLDDEVSCNLVSVRAQ